MATLGSNLRVGSSLRLKQKLFTLLGSGYRQLGKSPSACPIFTKAGIPASNTAADDPTQTPAFIINTTGNSVYFCNAYTNSTTFTIVKVSA
jgi:hypothetical protein